MISTFSNKELHSIHLTAAKSIDSHLSQLNEASNDIKALEATLQKAGISINFKYFFDETSEIKQSHHLSCKYARVESQHYIIWDRDKQRLIYQVQTTEKEIVAPSEKSSKQCGPYISISKPIIETKAHIRLKILPELQFFYSEITKFLGKGQFQDEVTVFAPKVDIFF